MKLLHIYMITYPQTQPLLPPFITIIFVPSPSFFINTYMASSSFSILLLFSSSLFSLFLITTQSQPQTIHHLNTSPSSYLSSPTTTLLLSYRKMLHSLKIFIYNNPNTPFNNYTTPSSPQSIFFSTLQNSHFLTHNPKEAHLFFLPLSPNLSPRSLSRFIQTLRTDFPYWNRSLGADHFFFSSHPVRPDSSRNVVELTKNSVQISTFPAGKNGVSGGGFHFIPHKDLTLPPVGCNSHAPPPAAAAVFLGYVRHGTVTSAGLIDGLVKDSEFLVELEPSDETTFVERLGRSKFCLFEYGNDVSWIGEALRFGCVPVVIADGPLNDLPFVDVLRWQEMAVFLRSGRGGGEMKRVLSDTWRDRGERMRGLGVAASKHFVWNEKPEPLDAFHTVMYQLWLRRHTIRYARAESHE